MASIHAPQRGAAPGLSALEQMILALVEAVESPALGVRIMEVPEIRAAHLNLAREVTRNGA